MTLILATRVEDLNLFDKSICVDVFILVVVTLNPNLCYIGYYNRNVNSGLEWQQFGNKIGLSFLRISTQISSPILMPLFCDFFGKLCTFHMDLHPPTHVQLSNSNGGCFLCVAFDSGGALCIMFENHVRS